MKIYHTLLIVPLLLLFSCAHQYPMDPGKDEILSTSNGKSRPSWAMDKPRFVKKKQLFVSGMVEVDGDDSPAKGLMAADLQARANLLSELKTRLHAQLQYATEGFNVDQQRLNNIISESIEVSNVSGLYISERFYEKVKVKNRYSPRVKYACYSLATISLDKFKEAVQRNLKAEVNSKELTKEFERKSDEAWEKFFNKQGA